MDFVQFEIELSATEGSGYAIRAESPFLDPIDAVFALPYDERELAAVLDRVELAVLKGSGRRRSLQTEHLEVVKEFGSSLFQALISGEVAEAYYDAYRRAAERQNGLRVTISAHPPELAALPWEFLFDVRRGDFVALSTSTPLVRHLHAGNPVSGLSVSGALRVLGMVSSPRELGKLDEEAEKERMRDALAPLIKRGHVELRWVQGGTWRDLQQAMRDGPWHVFHYIGHGQFDRNRHEGVLAFEPEDGGPYRAISPAELNRLIEGDHSLRLVVLNACEGARGDEQDALSSMAAYLAKSSAPAVLAMQWEISDASAIEFSRTFYDSVSSGVPIDAAVAEARLAISMAVHDSLEWATPVIYMRTPDGKIFDVSRPDDRPSEQLSALARQAMADNDWDLASSLLDELLEHSPDDADGRALSDELERRRAAAALYERAHALFDDRSWQGVIEVFDEIGRLDAGMGDPEHLRSRAAAQLAVTVADADRSGREKETSRSADDDLVTKQSTEERSVERISFRTSRLWFWLKAELTLTNRQLQGRSQNTMAGLIPTGRQEFTYPLRNITQVSVSTRFRPIRLVLGVAILGFVGAVLTTDDPFADGGVLYFLYSLIGVLLVVGSVGARFSILDSGRGKRHIPVRWAERRRVQEFAAAVSRNLARDE